MTHKMFEASWVLGTFSALLLAGAVAIWAKVLRGPLLQRLDGKRGSDAAGAEWVSKMLVAAVAVGAIAAVLAIVARWLA